MLISVEQRNRARGAILGLAVGDALGTTLEFRARDTYAPLTDMVGGGPFKLAPGVWTDDTALALALADSLAGRDALDPHDLMERFLGWWREGEYSPTGECFDIGITTSEALARYAKSGDPFAGSTDPMSAGNGSLMRLAPVSLWGLGRNRDAMLQAARDQSRTTHGAATCLDACAAFSVILAETIQGAALANALAAAGSLNLESPVAAIIAGSWRGKGRDAIRSSGYVVHSLEAALWCVYNSTDFASCVLLAANLGEDADTTAAITGQLAGSLYGMSAIPPQWLERLAWRDRLVQAADALIGS